MTDDSTNILSKWVTPEICTTLHAPSTTSLEDGPRLARIAQVPQSFFYRRYRPQPSRQKLMINPKPDSQ